LSTEVSKYFKDVPSLISISTNGSKRKFSIF
jgi:hypothetical protein